MIPKVFHDVPAGAMKDLSVAFIAQTKSTPHFVNRVLCHTKPGLDEFANVTAVFSATLKPFPLSHSFKSFVRGKKIMRPAVFEATYGVEVSNSCKDVLVYNDGLYIEVLSYSTENGNLYLLELVNDTFHERGQYGLIELELRLFSFQLSENGEDYTDKKGEINAHITWLIAAIKLFKAYSNLSAAWDYVGGDIGSDQYPFSDSFGELQIKQWIDAQIELFK